MLALVFSSVLLMLPQGKAPTWSLKDTSDVSYTSASFEGKTVLLIGGDKKSQDTNSQWATRMRSACGSTFTGFGLADLSAAPRLLRGLFRNQIKADAAKMGVPILLDWDGSVAHSFHFQPEVSNVYVIGPDAAIRYQTSGPPADEAIKQACAAAGNRP